MGIEAPATMQQFEIVGTGMLTIALPGGGPVANTLYSTTFAHNLSYVPACLGFLSFDGGNQYVQLPYIYLNEWVPSVGTGGTFTAGAQMYLQTNTTNITAFFFYGNMPLPVQILQGGLAFKYYLLRERAA